MPELALVSNDPSISASPDGMRLDLGCGQNPKEGFEGVDLHSPLASHKVNLFKFPFPWADSSVSEIWCSHFLEHVPAREVEGRDLDGRSSDLLGQDMLCAFMDECWRVLKPNGKMTIIVPNGFSNGGLQDPTHRRYFVQETFAYFSKAQRDALKLGHYLGKCDFDYNVVPVGPAELGLLHQMAQARRFKEHLNTIWEYHATLAAKK